MSKALSYPSKLSNTDLNPAWLSFQFYERKSPTNAPPDDTISLYMPETASQPSTVSWDTEKFGFVGNAIAGGADGGAWETAGQGAALLYERGKANIQAGIANRLGGRVNAESLMGESTGKIPNPYLTMVFRGVDFRSFAFSFKFFPFTEKDSDTIHDIIKTFRKNSLPGSNGGDAFIGYPKEVEVAYKWKSDDNPYLHKFKRSVITAVDVDYTPNGMFAVMRNGMPACIQMNIKLSEIELVMRPDVEKGF